MTAQEKHVCGLACWNHKYNYCEFEEQQELSKMLESEAQGCTAEQRRTMLTLEGAFELYCPFWATGPVRPSMAVSFEDYATCWNLGEDGCCSCSRDGFRCCKCRNG